MPSKKWCYINHAGLSITVNCTATPLRGNAVEIPCAATLKNITDYTMITSAVSVNADGTLATDILEWMLLPNQVVSLPDPPSGSTWVVQTESLGLAEAMSWLDIGALVVVGALAGIGLADAILAVARRRRR